jgi:hypothetical protein
MAIGEDGKAVESVWSGCVTETSFSFHAWKKKSLKNKLDIIRLKICNY